MKTKFMIYLDGDLLNSLKAVSADTGAPVAELVRRAIKNYLSQREDKGGK